MRIGLDIDGCMTDFSDHLEQLLIRDYGLREVDKKSYAILEQVGIYSKEDQKEFFKKHKDYFNSFEAKNGCSLGIRLMKFMKNNDYLILTARPYDEAIETEKWLQKNGIFINDIYFGCENKIGVCKWKKIDVMVEDNISNAEILANNGIKVLLMDAPYNEKLEHENIKRCHTWGEVYKEINELTYKKIK